MSTDSVELFALALALGADDVDHDASVRALVNLAGGSVTTLMGAYARGLGLARDLPFDTTGERVLAMVTDALQLAVRMSSGRQADEGATLLAHIVEAAGSASVAPGAVAARSAEVEADVDKLRPPDDEEGDDPGGDGDGEKPVP